MTILITRFVPVGLILSLGLLSLQAQPPHAHRFDHEHGAVEGSLAVPGVRGWFYYDPDLPEGLQAELEMDARELARYLQNRRQAAQEYHEQNARALGDYYRYLRERGEALNPDAEYDVRTRPVPQPAPWTWRSAPRQPMQPQPAPAPPQRDQRWVDPYDFQQPTPQRSTPTPDQHRRSNPAPAPNQDTAPDTDNREPEPSQTTKPAPQTQTPRDQKSESPGKVRKFLKDTFGPPTAEKVPDSEGMVYSPFAEGQKKVDIRGLPPGTEVKDPYTGKTFIVP